MNIVVLSGSPRKGANTDTMVEAFAETAREGGHTVEVGIGDAVLRHEIVHVHQNHLSKPSSLSVLPLGGVIPW